jgi:hypothetical protein
LAWDTGDHATARRWAAAVTTLWGSADPVLRGTTERMNTYRK